VLDTTLLLPLGTLLEIGTLEAEKLAMEDDAAEEMVMLAEDPTEEPLLCCDDSGEPENKELWAIEDAGKESLAPNDEADPEDMVELGMADDAELAETKMSLDIALEEAMLDGEETLAELETFSTLLVGLLTG